MSQSCFNFSLNENKRIAEDFGEIETQKLIELYFPDKNPASYNEFISNDKVKEALGLKGITEANKLLNTNYKKEISNQQLINLKSIISQTNNKLKGENKNIVYKLYNVKQLGESDNYTWGIREIKGNLDVDAKIERALTRGKTEQAKNLKNLNDNNQLTLFQLPNKQIIKPEVQELFDSNPELANQVYEALGFKNQTPKRLTKSDRTLSKYISIGKSEFEKAQKEANTKSSDFNHNGFRWYESEDELFGGKDWRKDELPQSNSGTFEDDYYKLQVEFSQKARSFVIDKIKEFFKTKGWLESKELGTGFFDSGREEDVLEQLIGFNDIVEELNKKEYDEAVRKNASLSKLISWLEYNHPEDFDEMGFELLYDLPQDELFQAIRYWYKPLEGIEFTELADIYDPNSSYNKKHPEDIKSKDASDLRKFIEKEIGIKNKLYPSLNNQITPQQKQQAISTYSQYLESLNKPNTNPILQGNQQEQLKKFKELQERLSNKEFLEGARFAYESTPALQQYGTQEEYNDYIARVSLGILKNPSSGEYNYTSKVKDIVYHGTRSVFEKFDKAFIGKTLMNFGFNGYGFYFDRYQKNAIQFMKVYRDWETKTKVVSALLNIKNPQLNEDFAMTSESNDKQTAINYTNKLKNEGKDGVLTEKHEEYVVFEPEQIHILGSKQDIEGFKEFVDKTPQQTLFQLQPEQTDSKEIIEQIDKNLNDYIKNNNINIEFKNQVLDSNGNDVVAFYDGVKKVIEINEGKRDSKTLPEELAHHLHLALGKDHILVKRAFNLLNRVDYKAMLGQEYVDLYKNNTDLLKFEILGKLTAAAVRGEKIPLQMNTVEGNKLWDTIKRMINAVIKLFKSDANVQKELDNLTNQFADILKSGVKIDSESALKFKLYQFNQNNFDIKTDFIMSPNNFKLLDEGKKTVTLRNTNYPSGIYKFGENYYKVHNKFNEPVYLNDVQDSDLKKKFIGSEEIIKDYVNAFFKNEEKMYVYYIEKLDDVTQKLIKDQVENNRQALINIDINVKAAYVYYNKLLKKLKKDNLNYPDPNNPIRKSNEQKIKDIDLALKELTRLDNIQPLINLVNITLDEIDSYINRLDLILNNGGKPNFSNVSSTLATLNKLIDFPTTEKTAAELRRRLNVYLQMAVKEETDRLTGRDNKYDELFGLQEDISTAKKNFGTLVDIKNLLGRSLGLLIKESQNNIERDNSEIYNLIKEKTDNLEKWAKSENINLEKAYDILQQEYKGTYVLTKPYTSDFYKLINDSFDKPNGHEIRKKIAKFDNNIKEFIPLDKKYVNSNYTKIQNTPALKEYYEFFKATTKNVSDNILPLNLSDNFIPNIYQKTLIDIFNTEEALDEKTKKAVQHILDFNIFEKMTDDKKYLFDESLMEGDLDLKYLKNLPTDVKSKDLSYNLLKFMYFANSYNHMSEVLEKAKVFLEVSKNVKFIKSNDPTLSIQGDKSSTYDMMQSFFDMQVLGKLKKEQKIEVLGYNFNYGNLFDLLTGFTSLLRLGLNPFNAIANVLTGTVGNVIEATGGRYFNIADYIKARKIFAEMVIDTDSKLYKLIYKINPLQELDDYENLKKIGIGTAKYWEKVKSIMFSPQRFGEFNLQTTPMIAIMLHTDVDIIKNGKVVGKTKMWDAFNEDGEWDTAKMGYELSDFELNRLTNKIHRVNQMIHGRYSSKDASILSQDVFFRMAFQFKKWIPAAIESRLGAEQYDERLDDTVKGRWRSYGPFIKYYMGGLWSKAIGDAKALENNKPLSDIDKYNMYKNAVELIIAAGILLLTKGIEDEEDKKKAWYKLTMRQLNQLSGDLLYFYNPKEMSESAFGGVAAAKTIKDIARTVNYIPYAFADENNQKAYYRSGKRKHENKFWAGMLDITPGAKSITESVRLFKGDVPYTEPVD